MDEVQTDRIVYITLSTQVVLFSAKLIDLRSYDFNVLDPELDDYIFLDVKSLFVGVEDSQLLLGCQLVDLVLEQQIL